MRLFSTETKRDRVVNLFVTTPILIIIGSFLCAAFGIWIYDAPWSKFKILFVIVLAVMFPIYLFLVVRLLFVSRGKL